MSEKILDKYVLWVPKTKEVPSTSVHLLDLKEKLLKERGVRVRDALEVINQRKLASEPVTPQVPAL
jgi:rRNA pseudouridine-1189 N-methylase Emg1 (Nep1/Mra1 family)